MTVLVAALSVVNGLTGAGRGDNLALGPGSLRQAVEGTPASFFSLIVLILAIAGEFHHQTATQTFLVTPRRDPVVAARLMTYASVGLAFAALALVVTLAMALPWLAAEGVEVSLFDGEVGMRMVGRPLLTALYGVIGAGLGALLRNQTAAVAAAAAWVMGIEGIHLSGARDLKHYQWLTLSPNSMRLGGLLVARCQPFRAPGGTSHQKGDAR